MLCLQFLESFNAVWISRSLLTSESGMEFDVEAIDAKFTDRAAPARVVTCVVGLTWSSSYDSCSPVFTDPLSCYRSPPDLGQARLGWCHARTIKIQNFKHEWVQWVERWRLTNLNPSVDQPSARRTAVWRQASADQIGAPHFLSDNFSIFLSQLFWISLDSRAIPVLYLFGYTLLLFGSFLPLYSIIRHEKICLHSNINPFKARGYWFLEQSWLSFVHRERQKRACPNTCQMGRDRSDSQHCYYGKSSC